VSLGLRWTEHAVNQLGAIAEHISLVSPIYAEQTVDRIAHRFLQAQALSRIRAARP
jgi:plasmid stabilization system protein ParE